MSDPVAAYFEKLPQLHKRQFAQQASGASFYFQKRLTLACELASASAGRLLDCAAGTGEITCALLKSGRFSHATVVDISPAMLQSAKELLSSQIPNTELEFIRLDVFNFKPADSGFDLVLCLGLIAHVGTRIVRALTARSELAKRGYRISWFSQRDVADACHDAGLRIAGMRRHSLGIPFGDRLWPWANFQLETRLQKWASRHGADAIYLLAANHDNREMQ